MGVDSKSQHVGNHGGVYTDIDGQTKQFTVIDHDRHTTRLKSWKSAAKVEHIRTPQELLVEDIQFSGINSDGDFIKAYDTTIAEKHGFKRGRQGSSIENLLDDTRLEDGYYNDLELIFKETLKKRIAEMQGYLKKKYGV